MEDSVLIYGLKQIREITSGRQRKYYNALLDIAKDVTISPLADVLTDEEIHTVKTIIKPEKKQCFKNAYLFSYLFNGAEYVEGQMSVANLFGISHAFNKFRGKYIDITAEIALKVEHNEEYYLSFVELSFQEAALITEKNGFFGDICNTVITTYLESIENGKG
jgi:predicted transcriptional regulator